MPENNQKTLERVPEPALRRLPWYLSYVKLLKGQGVQSVSSTQLSRGTGIDASQIAKDFSYVKIPGRTRVGYNIDTMIAVLEEFLWPAETHRAFLFGVGSLGAALLQDSGLKHYGLEIVGAFDVRDDLVGGVINGVPVSHLSELPALIKGSSVTIGILTVPIGVAQEVTNFMIENGIKGVWNFTPFRISVPEGIVVQNTSLYAHLAVMFNRLNV